eukprot:5868463-Prymnesium_polylepis.1
MRSSTDPVPSELPCRLATLDLCTPLGVLRAKPSRHPRHRRREPRLAPVRPPHCFDGRAILAALGGSGPSAPTVVLASPLAGSTSAGLQVLSGSAAGTSVLSFVDPSCAESQPGSEPRAEPPSVCGGLEVGLWRESRELLRRAHCTDVPESVISASAASEIAPKSGSCASEVTLPTRANGTETALRDRGNWFPHSTENFSCWLENSWAMDSGIAASRWTSTACPLERCWAKGTAVTRSTKETVTQSTRSR